jgi:hypothetical protein
MQNLIESAVRSAIPANAIVKFESNFNDIDYGWDIAIAPGTMLRVSLPIDNQMSIRIEKFTIITWSETLDRRTLYSGPILPNENYEPDMNFITQILKHWEKIG